MTPQQLLGTGVRLFSVWLALSSLAYFTSIPSALASLPQGSGATSTTAFAIGAAYLVGAILLWFFPMLVAHNLLPRTQHTNQLSFQASELARVGCSLLGLWLFARALPQLIWFMFRSLLVVDATSSFSALTSEARLELLVALFECAFALVVLFKSRAFARLVVPELERARSDL